MWGYLESNAWERLKAMRTSIDGILRPILPPSGRLTDWLSFTFNYAVDHAAVLDWTSKKQTRRH